MTQNIGLKRDTVDKYYTRILVAKKCIRHIKNTINIDYDNDLIIEPSAGNGAFIKPIEKACSNRLYYDILPEHKSITKQDFLNLDLDTLDLDKYNNVHIIGNPPFGRQCSMIRKFVKKIHNIANTISFILPKSFKKESMKKIFPLNYHLKFEIDLDENSFRVNKKIYDVPCVFQIWEKQIENREQVEKLKPNFYEFVKKDTKHHFAIRRVGVYAGKKITDTKDKSIQSHYFIKINKKFTLKKNKKILEKLYNDIDNIAYECRNYTSGPKSISKQELIKNFNPIFQTCLGMLK